MRTIIVLLALLLVGCKSNKQMVSDKNVTVDSIAAAEHHNTVFVIDSVMRSAAFVFDTLELNIQRPTPYAQKPELIRIKAVKGSVTDNRRYHRDSLVAYNHRDTVAYKNNAAEITTEHSTSSKVYTPPDGTIVAVLAIIIAALIVFLFCRKR